MRWRPGPTSAVRHPGPRRWSCFLRVSHLGWREHTPVGCPFVRHVTEGICVRMPPDRVPDAGQAALGEEAAKDAQAKDMMPRDGL